VRHNLLDLRYKLLIGMLLVVDLFLRKEPEVFAGIDIGNRSIYGLSLRKLSPGFRVDSFDIQLLPEQAVQNNEIKNHDAVSASLKKMLQTINVTDAVIAMPGSSVILKTIQLDKDLSDRVMEEQVWLEAGNIFSQKIEDMVFDFYKLGQSDIKSDKVDVMLVATRTENVNSRCSILTEAGFKVKIVDVNYFALANACSEVSSGLAVAIFNINFPVLSLIVLHDGAIIYTREDMITNTETASSIPLIEKIVAQMQHNMQFFYSAAKTCNIDKIIITGDIMDISDNDLIAKIKETMSLDASLADPFKNITSAAQVDQESLHKNAAAMTTSFGLALRGFCDDMY